MSNGARRMRGLAALTGVAALGLAACSGGGEAPANGEHDEVTLEFTQWWEPELPDGEFRALIDRFEEENPGITVELLSGPYAATREQVVAGAAAGTMSDVVGLDGAWVNDFAQQGSIADLSQIMSEAGYDDSQILSQVQVDGATYMIPVVNFVYPMFTNDEMLAEAGVDAPPSTRSEFVQAAEQVTALGDNRYGWVLPLSLETPNGIQNDVMSWVWASGGSMLTDAGQPALVDNDAVTSAVEHVQQLWDAGAVAPGAFTMKEQDKVEEFTNERVAMMISSLAHVNLIREQNPDLDFSIAAIPAEDGYTGERGIPFASWGIGISANSEHPQEAWKLVEFLMSESVNAELASMANAFPGNSDSVPDFVSEDELFGAAFEIYQAGYPANEFTGLPVAEQLMRSFSEELQKALDGQQSLVDALQAAQSRWEEEF